VPSASPQSRPRLDWVDAVKGIAILWIVLFHTFKEWAPGRYPWPLDPGYVPAFRAVCDPTGALETLACDAWSLVVAVIRFGYHPVGVFFLMSGFGLGLSLARGGPTGGWLGWLRKRVVRLFPMYWLAHLVCALSPLATTYEPIDHRFALSLVGDRIWPIEEMFYYLNPSWWYFGALLQFYLMFPLLWRLFERLGSVGFLVLAAVVTVGIRYWLLVVDPAQGYWVQGALALCRLWEFAFGMVLGTAFGRTPEVAGRRLFSPLALAAGATIFALGLWSSRTTPTYAFTDALCGTGLFILLAWVARAFGSLGALGRAVTLVGTFSYGLYLVHQPYVITLGIGLQGQRAWVFLAVSSLVIAAMAAIAIQIERVVNAAVARVV